MSFLIGGFFFFYFALLGVYTIYLPKVLETIGYSFFQIGIIFSIAPLMRFLLPFLFLKHINLNNKFFYYTLVGVFVSSNIFYFTINNFYLFLIPNIILGGCLGIVLPYIENYSLQKLGKEKYGKLRLYGSIGFMLVSLFLAKLIYDPISILHCFVFLGTIMIIFSFTLTSKDNYFTRLSHVIPKKINFKKNYSFWINIFLMQISFGGFYNFYTIYNIDNGLSIETTSYLWTFGVLCEVLWFYFQGPTLKKYNLLFLMKFATLVTAVRWFILFLFPGSVVFGLISQSLHAFSFALFHTTAFGYLHTIYENKKLASQLYYGISFGLGAFLGSIIAGIFYSQYIFLWSSFIAFLAFLALKK